jgi:hypothetical protein
MEGWRVRLALQAVRSWGETSPSDSFTACFDHLTESRAATPPPAHGHSVDFLLCRFVRVRGRRCRGAWRSTWCDGRGRKARGRASAQAPAGTTTTWPNCSPFPPHLRCDRPGQGGMLACMPDSVFWSSVSGPGRSPRVCPCSSPANSLRPRQEFLIHSQEPHAILTVLRRPRVPDRWPSG